MSATTHRVGIADEFGDNPATTVRSDVDARPGPPPAFDASAGDDWGTVLAVACLLVGLVVGVLLLGGR
jgi:hypothetical protein